MCSTEPRSAPGRPPLRRGTLRPAAAAEGIILGLLWLCPAARAAPADPIRLATLDQGAAAAPGDRITVIRPFGPWTLRCELSIGQNRRLCSLEQVLERPGGAVLWRLAQATDGNNVLVWSVPRNMAAGTGLSLRLDGFETRVSDWTCSTACLALTPVTKPLQTLLLSASTAEMTYTTVTGEVMPLIGSMAGFREALQAAAEDPFGKRVVPAPKAAAPAAKPIASARQRVQARPTP